MPEYAANKRWPTLDIGLTLLLVFTWLGATFAFYHAVRQIRSTVAVENVRMVVQIGSWCWGKEVTGCEVESYILIFVVKCV